jgi:uncharacterized Zn finger protein
MTELHFFVRSSSSEEVYSVKAYRTKNGVRFSCSCPAGENGIHCKHRTSLVMGDVTHLLEYAEADVAALHALLNDSKIPETVAEILRLEKIADAAKRDLSSAKKRLDEIMHG